MAKALEDGSLDQDRFIKSYRAAKIAELKKQASLGHERYGVCAHRLVGVVE